MLMQLSQDLGLYFYDVFVARFDFWARLRHPRRSSSSRRASWCSGSPASGPERSVIPLGFWFLSIGGGLMTLVYGLARRDPSSSSARAFSIFIYLAT